MREFGSEHPAVLVPDGYFRSFSGLGYCTWLRSGREALHLVALNCMGVDRHPTVLMPAYCCHSMVDPFIKAGWAVRYYPLNEDLTVASATLQNLLTAIRPQAVLSMNYYGATPTDKVIRLIKSIDPDCICIEDFTHYTFSLDLIYNPLVDFYVSSIRKSVGVCDGAVIIGKEPLDESFVMTGTTEFVMKRKASQWEKARYRYTQDQNDKRVFLSQLREQEAGLDHFEGVYRISDWGKDQLESINGAEVRFARQQNMAHILDLLGGKVESVPGIEKCLEGAPFSLPVLVENRDEIQGVLASAGVYAPVLWPIPEEARTVCPVSANLADRLLSIPIDQRYGYDDIEDIARVVLRVCC